MAMKMQINFRQTMLVAFAAALLAGGLAAPVPRAAAQTQNELRAVIDRMQRLEAEVNQLQRQVYRGGATPSGAPAAGGAAYSGAGGDLSTQQFNMLAGRLDELEAQIRTLTGRLEELDHRTNQTAQRTDKLVQDVDFRLAQMERQSQQGASAAPTAAAPAAGAPATSPSAGGQLPTSSAQPGILGTIPANSVPAGQRSETAPAAGGQVASAPQAAAGAARAKLPAGSPQEQYNYATSLLHKGDYAGAEAALTEFVNVNGKDPLASAAQYWLGESHFARKQYKESAQAFLDGYQKYPKGSKAPDSLLKLGLSLQNLKQKQESCAVYKQLLKEYPNAEARIKQAAQREQKEGGCPA